MQLHNFAVALALSLALAAGCKKPANETSDTRTAPSPTAPMGVTETTGATSPAMANTDVELMKKAALGSMFEVKLGNEAQNRATRPEVKSFASHMVIDHGKASSELKDLAAKKNVVIPTALDDEHNKKESALLKLSGPQFDDKYMKEMIDDHEKDVKELQKAASDAKDPDLKSWAQAALPTFTNHLQMARDIEGKKGAASTGTHHR